MRAAALLVLLLLMSSARIGMAGPEDPARQALELGYRGDELYMKGAWDEAYDAYDRAERLVHSPVFVLSMARSRKNAGRLLEAAALYERIEHEPVDASSPKPFRDAVAAAAIERKEVLARVAVVDVDVRGPEADQAVVRIDGRVAPKRDGVMLDPGAHVLSATAHGRQVDKKLTLGAGPTRVELDLAPRGQPDRGAKGSVVPAIIALSVGVAGIGVGAVAGAVAVSRKSDLVDACPGRHCLPEDASDLDSAKTIGNVSTIGFVVGGVGLAAAVVLFVVRPGSAPHAAATAASLAPAWSF